MDLPLVIVFLVCVLLLAARAVLGGVLAPRGGGPASAPGCGACGHAIDLQRPLGRCPECGAAIAAVGVRTPSLVVRERSGPMTIGLGLLVIMLFVGAAGREALFRGVRGPWPPDKHAVLTETIRPEARDRRYPQLMGIAPETQRRRAAFFEETGVEVAPSGRARLDRDMSEMYELVVVADVVTDDAERSLRSGALSITLRSEGVDRCVLETDLVGGGWTVRNPDGVKLASGSETGPEAFRAFLSASPLAPGVFLEEEALALHAGLRSLGRWWNRMDYARGTEVPPGRVTPDGELFDEVDRSRVITPIQPRVAGMGAGVFATAVAVCAAAAMFAAAYLAVMRRRATLLAGEVVAADLPGAIDGAFERAAEQTM